MFIYELSRCGFESCCSILLCLNVFESVLQEAIFLIGKLVSMKICTSTSDFYQNLKICYLSRQAFKMLGKGYHDNQEWFFDVFESVWQEPIFLITELLIMKISTCTLELYQNLAICHLNQEVFMTLFKG